MKKFLIHSCILFTAAFCFPLQAENIEILHWWTSDGEKAAAAFLKESLSNENVQWIDAAIPGGGGQGAMAVLKSRVLQGAAPGAAQIIGPDIQTWAELDFLGQFNIVALAHDWPNILHPTVDKLIRHEDKYVAVPFGVHRINWLWINKARLSETGMDIPTDWSSFFKVADEFKRLGITAISHGNEPWQNATLFENLVLSVGGPKLFHSVFVLRDDVAILSDDFSNALKLLSRMRTYMDTDINGRTWQQATQDLVDGEAGMQIMGDWVLGEVEAWGKRDSVICSAVPQTERFHLYSIDTMVMFSQPGQSSYEAQLKFAETVTRTENQLGYNVRKGSAPIRSDILPDQLNTCARKSYQVFQENERAGTLSPSLAHSMAAQAEVEDVFVNVIHDFFQSPDTSISQVQLELVRNLKSIRQ